MEDESWRSTHGACPPHTRAGLFLSQPDPSLTQPGPFNIQAGPCHTQAGSSDSQAGPSHTQAALSDTQAGSSHTQAGSSDSQAGPSHTQAGSSDNQREFTFDDDFCPGELDRYKDLTSSFSDHEFSFDNDLFPELDSPIDVTTPLSDESPSHIRADSFLTQSDPSLTQAGPCHTQAGPSNTKPGYFNPQNMLEFTFYDDVCRSKLDRYMDSTSPCSDLEFSFDDVLFPELDSPFDVGTPLSDAGPSDAQPHQECSPSFTQSRTSPTQTGTSQIQAGPNQTQRIPSHTQIKMKTKDTKCIFCKKVFSSRSNLTRHMNAMHEENPLLFMCDHCGRSFLRSDRFQEHLRTQHPNSKPDYKCSKCGMPFTTIRSRTRHIMFTCPSLWKRPACAEDDPAGLTYIVEPGTSTGRSEQPLNLYTGCKRYVCSNCGCRYTTKKTVLAHLRHRCGFPPRFSCSLCPYKSHFKHNLKHHMLSKHGSELPQ